MNKRKWNIRWLLIPAALVVLLLLLTMCTGSCTGKPEETVPVTETTAAPTQTYAAAEQTEETTEPSQETTAPTEETTEATEAPEETTPATTAPDSDSDDYDPEEEVEPEYVEFPDPGTPENPYVEVPEGYPSEVVSVNIPRGTDVSYLITGAAGSVITVKQPGVTLTVDGKTYTADETTGELTVDLSKVVSDPVIQLSHSGSAAASCVLTLAEGLGGAGNPEILTDPSELEVQLPAGDDNGYHYSWNSTITGQVELTLKEKEAEAPEETREETEGETSTEPTQPEAETPVLEIIVTVGDQVYKLSECADGKLLFDAEKEQEVKIQVIAQPFSDGSYPAIEETVLWNLLPAAGTEENPETIESVVSIPVKLEPGDIYGHHYRWTATTCGNVTLTTDQEDLDIVATVAGETRKLSECEDKALTFHVDKGQEVLLQAVAIAQTEPESGMLIYAEIDGSITGTLEPDAGTPENPVVLETIETVAVTLAEGDSDGYTCQWTAACSGTLELTAENAGTTFDVILTNADTVQRLSESETKTLTAETKAGDTLTIQVIAIAGEDGSYSAGEILLKGSFAADAGSSPANPIVISDPQSGTTVSVEAWQTLYFSGMVHEMVARVEDASGISLHHEDRTAWGSQTGVAELEFPEADADQPEAPVVFSVTSKKETELILTFAYPEGHARNPAALVLGENKVQLEEQDEDGYLLHWRADCDGQLTVAVEGRNGWQYRLDNGEPGQLYTSSQEPAIAVQTIEVKAGNQVALTLWTLAAEDGPLPAGTLSVTASFFDPLLGTEAKPIRLDSAEEKGNSVTIPAGQTLFYYAEAEGMVLTFAGQEVTLTHNGAEYLPEKGSLELLCHGKDSVFRISNSSEKDQTCKLRFAYPQGHCRNPAPLTLGENTAVLTDSTLSGYAFVWTAETAGELSVTMAEEAGWQYLLRNETTGTEGIVHTSEDQPRTMGETIEIAKGDRILVIVNTFDPEHPLKTPAGQVVFTAAFVDPTLGMQENPVWLNLEDKITVPAGKTMYCAAKADGMILTLTGRHVTLTHNAVSHTPVQNEVRVLCEGTGTFGHPVFAVTNTGTEDEEYTVSFVYPRGHFLNPAVPELDENSLKIEDIRKGGYFYLWTAERDGIFTFAMNSESGWKYLITNLTTGTAGEPRLSDAEQPIPAETLQVSAGDQIRILIDVVENDLDVAADVLCFTAAFTEHSKEP